MSEVIDVIDLKPELPTVNLKKAIGLLKVSGSMLLINIIAILLLIKTKVTDGNTPLLGVIFIIMGLMFIVSFVLSPVGLFFCLRSRWKKEGNRPARIKYTVGHLLIFLLLGLVFAMSVVDFTKLTAGEIVY